MDERRRDEAGRVLDRVRALHEQKAAIEARIAVELARYEVLTRPTDADLVASGGQVPDRGENDLAARMSWSAGHAAAVMGEAAVLVNAAPQTLAVLAAGRTDAARAGAVARAITVLDADRAHDVDAAVSPFLGTDTLAQLKKRLAVEVEGAAPGAATARHRRGVRNRGTWVRHLPDGLAELVAVGPAPDVVAAGEALRRRGRRAAHAPGETRTPAQLRFDLLVADAVAGEAATTAAGTTGTTGTGSTRPLVNVTVALTTLLGMDDHPGHLDQYGPIPADLARTIAAHPGARLRRLVTDPVTGVLISVDDHTHPGLHPHAPGDPTHPDPRFPSTRLQRTVRHRDTTCTVPWCTVPSTRCDLDHTVPWPRGRTCWCDLHPLCRRHHRMKQTHGWTVHRALDGTTTWTTPTGHRITRALDPVLPSPRCSTTPTTPVTTPALPGPTADWTPHASDPTVTDAEWAALTGADGSSELPPDPHDRDWLIHDAAEHDLVALRAHVRATTTAERRLVPHHGETPPF